MNVGNVRGVGGVDPTPNRPETTKQPATANKTGHHADQASISTESKEAFAVVRALTERVKQEPEVRQDRVDEARQRLESGELDTAEAFRATAERLLDEI